MKYFDFLFPNISEAYTACRVLCANCPYMFDTVQMMIIKRGVGEKRTTTQTRFARCTYNTIPTTMLYKF